MRLAIGAAPRFGIVHGEAHGIAVTRLIVLDRKANGEAFPGEIAVRIPRRFTQSYAQRWYWANQPHYAAARRA